MNGRTPIRHTASVVVAASAERCFRIFSEIGDFPQFMKCLTAVTRLDPRRSRWEAVFLGRRQWEAREDGSIPNREIGWRSVKGWPNFGRVSFRPQTAKHTAIALELYYELPCGRVGQWLDAVLLGKAVERVLQENLSRFACVVERISSGMHGSIARSIPMGPRAGGDRRRSTRELTLDWFSRTQ